MPYKDQKYIIEAIKNGSYNSLDDFFEKLAKNWKNSRFSKNQDIEDLEDIYQDAVISLILRIKSKKSFHYNIYAYFMAICRNKLFDKIEKDKRKNVVSTDIFADFNENPEIEEIKYGIFSDCFKKLTAENRNLFLMRFNGLSSKEIASKLGIAPNNVDQKFYTCRELLRKCARKHPLYELI